MKSLEPAEETYYAGCIVSLLGLLVTLAHHKSTVRALRARTAFSAKRLLYRLILSLAPALAAINFLAVTSPSPAVHRFAGFAQHVLVAGVMACFMELLLLLLFRTSLASVRPEYDPAAGSEAAIPGIANVLQLFEASFSKFEASIEPSRYMEAIVGVLRAQQPINYWASPPLGCGFALCPSLPCGARRHPSARQLAVLRRAVLVYAAGAFASPLLEMWVEGVPCAPLRSNGPAARHAQRRAISDAHVPRRAGCRSHTRLHKHREGAAMAARVLEGCVTLLALYSLFITYRLSRVPLASYHTSLKFASVKVRRRGPRALTHWREGAWPGASPGRVETVKAATTRWRGRRHVRTATAASALAAPQVLVFVTPLQRTLAVAAAGDAGLWWSHVLTLVETPLLSLLLARAFPAAELPAVARAIDSDDESANLMGTDERARCDA